MAETADLCHPEAVRVAASHQAEASRIAAELAAIAGTGMVLPGSITRRRTRCRLLSPEQHHDYQAWIDNDRRLRELLARLEALGAAALDADPRWQRKARQAPADTSQTTP